MRTDVTSKGSSCRVKSIALTWAMLSTALPRSPPMLEALERAALRQKHKAKQAEDGRGAGESNCVCRAAAPRALLFARVQQHDDEDEEHHDGARVDDDLRGGQELRAQRPVEDGQRHHHHHQRQRAVDGVALEEQVQCSAQCQCAKEDEECQLHRVPSSPSLMQRRDGPLQRQGQKLSGVY